MDKVTKTHIRDLYGRYSSILKNNHTNDIEHHVSPKEVMFDLSYILKIIEKDNDFLEGKLRRTEVELWINIFKLVKQLLENIKDTNSYTELNKELLESDASNYGDVFNIQFRANSFDYDYSIREDDYMDTASFLDREKVKELYLLKEDVDQILINRQLTLSDIVPGLITSIWGVATSVLVLRYLLVKYID